MKTRKSSTNSYNEKSELDLSDWMDKLSEDKKNEPLSKISIPGTHDSFTYSLNRNSPVGPDEPRWVRRISQVFGCLSKWIIYRWAKCQKSDCLQQLQMGIRYFDFRLAKFRGKGKNKNKHDSSVSFRIIHALFGEEIENILSDINSFLNQHPGEVVILDFQHLYDFKEEDHDVLVSLLKTTFGPKKLSTWQANTPMYSLNEMLALGQRVVVVYPALGGTQPFLWPRTLCQNPWPHTTKVRVLRDVLTQDLDMRDPNSLFVTQGVLTPDTSTVFMNLFSSLEKLTCKRCNKFLVDWLGDKEIQSKNPNIIICDFPEQYELPNLIVSLNIL